MQKLQLMNKLDLHTRFLLSWLIMISSGGLGSAIGGTVIGVLGLAITVIVALALGPTITDAVANVNLTGVGVLTDVINLIFDYAPAMYYIAIGLGLLVGVWAVIKFKK